MNPDHPPEKNDSEDLEKGRRRNREFIALLLTKLRTRIRARESIEFGLWILVLMSTLTLIVLVLALVFPSSRPAILYRGFWILGGVSLSTILIALVAFFTTKPSLYTIAGRLQNAYADFRSDIIAALEFSEPDETFEFHSEILASEHIERCAKKLHQKEAEGVLYTLIPQRPLGAPFLGLIAALAVISTLYFLNVDTINKAIDSLFQEVSKQSAPQKAKRPLIGDIMIEFTFPKYAKKQREVSHSTGNIRTLSGTEVLFKTYPLIAAKDFEIVFVADSEDVEQETFPLLRLKDRTLEAKFIVTKKGTYEVRAINEKGVLVDPLIRKIEVQKDLPPALSITSHQGSFEVSPKDQIEFSFEVSDDFGVENINGVTYFVGEDKKENRIPYESQELAQVPLSLSGRFTLDLATLKLKPKDRIVFRMEANDNNALTGPGRGLSAEIVLTLTSPQNKHLRLIAEQQKIRDALIDHLGDVLANPIGRRVYRLKGNRQSIKGVEEGILKTSLTRFSSLMGNENALLERMNFLIAELESDPLLLKRDFQTFKGITTRISNSHQISSQLTKTLNENFDPKKMSRLARMAAKHEHLLEKSLLSLEDLLRQQKIDAISDTQAEIREIRDRLKELLEKYKKSKAPDLKAAIFREIARLRQRMSELLQRMQNQVQNLPRDHINMDALEEQELVKKSKDLATGVEKIEDLLKKNDIDGAIAALEELTKSLNELNAQLDSEMGEQQGSGVSELDSELNALMDKVNDLELAQKSIEKETRDLELKNEASKEKEIEKLLSDRLEEIIKLLKLQVSEGRLLPNTALSRNEIRSISKIQSRTAGILEALKRTFLEGALEDSLENYKALRSLEFSLELSQSYRSNRKSRKKISKSIETLQEMIPRQREVSNRLRNLIEEAKKAKQESTENPKFDPIEKKQKQVSKQAKKLKKEIKKASEKFPMLQSELGDAIKKSEKEMKASGKELKKKRAQQSLDHQRSALEELRKMKKSMQETMEKQRQGDGKKSKGEKVVIPKNEKKKTHIRDEIQKRMKDGKLNDYASEIEQYYKSLTR